MKTSKLTCLLAIVMALSFAVTGCKRKPGKLTDLPGYRPDRIGGEQVVPPPTRPIDPNEGLRSADIELPDLGDIDKFNQDRAALETHKAFFDFDSYAVKSSERSKVDAVATFLQSAPANVALLIEGHCDERGTEEYNRSLGERRALALREALMAAGANGMRITTRSFGEDRPAVPGQTESAYRQNRRGEFVVLTPK